MVNIHPAYDGSQVGCSAPRRWSVRAEAEFRVEEEEQVDIQGPQGVVTMLFTEQPPPRESPFPTRGPPPAAMFFDEGTETIAREGADPNRIPLHSRSHMLSYPPAMGHMFACTPSIGKYRKCTLPAKRASNNGTPNNNIEQHWTRGG